MGSGAGITVWYGDQEVLLDLPAGVTARVVTPPAPEAAGDPLAVVAAALDGPIDAPPLEEAARGCARVAVVVPDASRRSGADVYLLPVIARLARAGLEPRQITLVVARGIHPTSSRAEVQRILGPGIMEALSVVQSAPDTPDLNASIGTDDDLGDVRVHRLVAHADLVVLTGPVTPHHLAGFGGGPKSLVPGVAQRETVLAAHRLTLRAAVRPDGSVRSLAGRMEDNPFREALLRVTRAFGRCWNLGVVLSPEGVIAAAAAGETGAAHAAAAATWQRDLDEAAPEPADLVVVGSAAPRDRDLVQAHKALLAAMEHARPGAPIVWFARARSIAGHAPLLPWFEIRKATDHLAALRREFHPYGLTAYSMRRIAARHPVHVVSEVDADLLRPMGFLPFPDGKRALAHALEHHTVRTCTVLPSPIA